MPLGFAEWAEGIHDDPQRLALAMRGPDRLGLPVDEHETRAAHWAPQRLRSSLSGQEPMAVALLEERIQGG